MDLRYGFEWDRDYFLGIIYSLNSVLPYLSSVTIYPAKFYLLMRNPAMNPEIRFAYIINLVALIACDYIFTVFIRIYTFPPYGLYYCEGLLCKTGLNKRIIMAVFSTGIMFDITTFYLLMIKLHQATISDQNSRWKLSWKMELFAYLSLTANCMLNMAGYAFFTSDVDNYEEIIERPELAWLVQRGGQLLLFSEPGRPSWFIVELFLIAISVGLFLPFLLFFVVHALIYLRKSEQSAKSTRTQQLTRRLFITFIFQMTGAIFFFTMPLGTILVTSVIDLSAVLPGPLLAVMRFISILFLELNTIQTVLVFILRNYQHLKWSKISSSSYPSSRRPSVMP